MPEENRKIELDLDADQPVKAKKVEGAWGLYEELAKAKEENGTTPPVADLAAKRYKGVNHLSGNLNFFDGDGQFLPGDQWFGMKGGSQNSAGAVSADVLALSKMKWCWVMRPLRPLAIISANSIGPAGISWISLR